jgi:glycosyltransferase involved in cell wall biosynthesis
MIEIQSTDHQPEPLVSVVIPCYNHGQYLGDAIQSILQQTYSNYEIIVVDDGSQDNTRAVADVFKGKLRYIWQENQGLSVARNTGIQAAQGELIGLLDADDLYEPEYLSELVAALKQHKSSDAIYCGFKYIDLDNQLLPKKIIKVFQKDQFYSNLLNGGFFPPMCMLAHKYCYEELGYFDRNFQGCADWDMWLRMANRFSIIGIPVAFTRYRVVPTSMSSDPIYMLEDRIAVLEKHLNISSDELQDAAQSVRRAFGRNYFLTAIDYIQSNDVEQAYQWILKAVTIFPELLEEREFYYELGCGNQPRGHRGHLPSINIEHSSDLTINILDRLFNQPELNEKIGHHRNRYTAMAYLVLGQLSYGTGNYPQTRRFLLQSIKYYPAYALNREFVISLTRSILGEDIIQSIKQLPSSN